MRVVKNINNNTSVCIDANGKEVVAFGKGIGFLRPPYEIDISQIERTYYDINPLYVSMINDIDDVVLDVSDRVVDYASAKLGAPLNANLVITLADHIQFAVRRFEQKLNVKLPLLRDIKHLHMAEVEIGEYALGLVRSEMGVDLPDEEAAYIALHIINSEYVSVDRGVLLTEEILDEVTRIIERYFNITLDRDGFSYSRFASHLRNLMKRRDAPRADGENQALYVSLAEALPRTRRCAEVIRAFLVDTHELVVSDEECLYLMLHINRLRARESHPQ